MEHYNEIRDLIGRVRKRWTALRTLQAAVRAALLASAVIAVALVLSRWTAGAPAALVALAVAALLAILGAIGWAAAPLRRSPGDAQVARFIEERTPALDDRLVTAVDVAAGRSAAPPVLAEPLVADAARRARGVDMDAILPANRLRRAAFQAAAAGIVFASMAFVARDASRRAMDAASLTLFPSRVTLEVTPGNAHLKAGIPFAVHARLVGNRAPVIAQLQIADGDSWRSADMPVDPRGGYQITLPSVSASFKYRVVAGAIASPAYDVSVAYAPRVTRIDVDYTYPAGLRLAPRTETDSGDIYAPAGTGVRLHIITDRPAAAGRMALGDGKAIALSAAKPTELTASLDVVADNSYRLSLADAEGIATDGDTEYFIRILEDRPPDVRILKPAADRSVTRLEEVDVEVQAEDDYGVERLELVYAVRGGAEKVVPLVIPKQSAAVKGNHTLFLEEMNVQPGDFVSYYARARDLTTHGTRPNEARSDIFFLEVKPYEQEFALAQSMGGMGSTSRSSLDELVAAQKEIVVATWKLDRRTQSTKGAKSEQDIQSVARAESELKTRVEETSSTFRESTMRDPRRGRQQRPDGRGGPPTPPPPAGSEPLKAGQTLPEEDDMAVAADAMGKAVVSLDALKTGDALPHEMDALNRLLKAQAAVKRREVTTRQSGSGSSDMSHSNVDLSTLFDRELQKAQQTNYETKSSAETKSDPSQSALDKIKDLARRQDELLKKQQELARNRDKMSEEQLRRELEKLTREQSELRQRAEEIARQQNQSDRASQSQQQQQANEAGQQTPSGRQNSSGQPSQGQSGGSQGQSSGQGQAQSGGSSSNDASKRMRDASEEMRNATSDLRRQDATQAAAAGNRALQRLREAQQQLEGATPDERRRAVGDLQLEARQLADTERQIASELGKAPGGEAGRDALRRLAGEQDRLAARGRALEESLRQQAAGKGGSPSASGHGQAGRGADSQKSAAQAQAAAGEAAKEIARQKLGDRMQQSADALRQATTESRGARGSTAPPDPRDGARGQAGAQQEIARALDRIADGLAAGADDAESRKLSDQLARSQALRDRMAAASRELDNANRQAGQSGRNGQGGRGAPGSSGKPGEGSQAGGGSGGPDVAKLRQDYERALKETKDLIDQARRDDPSMSKGGNGGFTFEEATAMTVTAPGTEAFKQDFAKWEDLRRQATLALENLESSLSKKLQTKRSKDRLAAGTDDKAPPEYKRQVDDYFKAIAKKKQ